MKEKRPDLPDVELVDPHWMPAEDETRWWTSGIPRRLQSTLEKKWLGWWAMDFHHLIPFKVGDIFEFPHLPGERFKVVAVDFGAHLTFTPEAGGKKSCIYPHASGIRCIERDGEIVWRYEDAEEEEEHQEG